MEEKVRIVMELDKNVVQTACFLANINLSDEVWQKMVAEPILFPTELAGEQKKGNGIGNGNGCFGFNTTKTGGNRIIMGYDLIPKKKGVDCKSGMIFTWPVILNETGACYLFGYGDHTFSPGKYIYAGSRKDGSPVSNDGFEVTKEEACIMARLFRGYVSVKRVLKEEWDQLSEQGQIKIKSMLGEKAEPPAEEFLHKIEMLADFCEQSEGFNIC